MYFKSNRQSGITLIEVIIAIGIVTVMLIAVGFSVVSYMNARSELLDDTKALYLAEEGYEMLRAIREDDWDVLDALALDQLHYFEMATTTLAATDTPEVIDGAFYRSFFLEEVCRDNSTDDIEDCSLSGNYVDEYNVSATIYVSGPTGTTSMTAILTNLHAI